MKKKIVPTVSLADEVCSSIAAAVSAGRFVVVCPGVTSAALPGLVGASRMNRGPVGPHPVATFGVNLR